MRGQSTGEVLLSLLKTCPVEKIPLIIFSQRKEVKVQCSGLLGMDMNLETPKFLLPSETE